MLLCLSVYHFIGEQPCYYICVLRCTDVSAHPCASERQVYEIPEACVWQRIWLRKVVEGKSRCADTQMMNSQGTDVWWAILITKVGNRHSPMTQAAGTACLYHQDPNCPYARHQSSHELLSHRPYRNHPKCPYSLAQRTEAVITY